jgi:hypothetical protein
MNRFSLWLLLGLLVALGTWAYAFYQQHQRQTRLFTQLQQLEQLLSAENIEANQAADNFLKGTEVKVINKQNQPLELAILDTARTLRVRTRALLDTLQAYRSHLLRATGNRPADKPFTSPDESGTVARWLGTDAHSQHALQRQLTTYSAILRRLSSADSLQIVLPAFNNQPVVAALAALAGTESDVLASEMRVLRYLDRPLGEKKLSTRIVAVATAKSNTVAPGATYQARMYLVKSLYYEKLALRMLCNGQPVAVDPFGVGQVRFIAPLRPGPAIWTGSIRFNMNGRDTTFQVRVPYRVAHR